jgi:hypothetical protein
MSVALAGVMLAACGADVGDSGSALRLVNEDAITSQVLYMLPEVSQVPYTALEMEERGLDTQAAIPIRVEVYDEVAVAWFAPGGEALVGRDHIVALWQVLDRTPIVDEVDPGSAPSLVGPTPFIEVDFDLAEQPDVDQELTTVPTSAAAQAIIDFWDRAGTPDEIWMLGVLANSHPGCI